MNLVRSSALTVVFGIVAACQSATLAAQQTPSLRLDQDYYRRPYTQLVRPSLLASLTAQRVETEPNDGFMTANLVAVGDTVGGFMNQPGDVDYFAVDIAVGGTRVDFDIDAFTIGSSMNAFLQLFDTDGTTLRDFSDDVIGLDPRIVFEFTQPGRYFVAVSEVSGLGGGSPNNFQYLLRIEEVIQGPGDPTLLRVTGLGGPLGAAATADGSFYVVDNTGIRVLRVALDQTVTELADLSSTGGGSNVDIVRDVAVDGFGNVLAVGRRNLFESLVWRITPAGEVSDFYVSPQAQSSFSSIAVEDDGTVWVADEVRNDPAAALPPVLLRFDPTGGPPFEAVDVSSAFSDPANGSDIFDLAFDHLGRMHLTNVFGEVYRIDTGGLVTQVISRPGFAEGLAFDRDGYLYLADGSVGRVYLYDPAYQLVEDPFAGTNMAGPVNLVFGRGTDGAATSRLFALNFGVGLPPPFAGALVEMAPGSIRAPGRPVGEFLVVASDTLRRATPNVMYADTLKLVEAAAPAVWTVIQGSLPAGFVLDSMTGAIGGTTDESGTYLFSVRAQSGGSVGFGSIVLPVGTISVAPVLVADAILGTPGVVSQADQTALDLQGNSNGKLDIGDLHAHLRVLGLIPGRPTAARSKGADR